MMYSNYIYAFNEAIHLKKECQTQLDDLTPQVFLAAVHGKSTNLIYNKEDKLFSIKFGAVRYHDYVRQQLKDKGFVDDLSVGNSIHFKLPQSSTNDYINSIIKLINDVINPKIHKSDHILRQITPLLITDLEMGIKSGLYFQKETIGYSIDLDIILNIEKDREEFEYVIDQLTKMGFSNVHLASNCKVHFQIQK